MHISIMTCGWLLFGQLSIGHNFIPFFLNAMPCIRLIFEVGLRGLNFTYLGKIAKLSRGENFATGPSAKFSIFF